MAHILATAEADGLERGMLLAPRTQRLRAIKNSALQLQNGGKSKMEIRQMLAALALFQFTAME